MSEKDLGISYDIRNSSRAKSLRISVHYDGRVVVTKPMRVSLAIVEQVVKKRLKWILDKVRMFRDVR